PFNRMAVHVTLGTVTYGKQTDAELQAIYDTDDVFLELRKNEEDGAPLDERSILRELGES
ncbi:MAG: hypothetical protein AAGA58_17580, partial [Verrucomicrobiota bacterium]